MRRRCFVLAAFLTAACTSPSSSTNTTQYVSLSVTYTRSATEPIPADRQVTAWGYQCNPSSNPKVPPWYCVMRSSDGRTFVCDSMFTIPVHATPCDNQLNVRLTPSIEQTARGISVNGQAIARFSIDFQNVEYAIFSVSPSGQVY